MQGVCTPVKPIYTEPIVWGLLVEHLEAVNATGVAMVLVEQNVRLCLQVSARAHVYERGRCVLEGASSDLLTDPLLERVCLGGLSWRS